MLTPEQRKKLKQDGYNDIQISAFERHRESQSTQTTTQPAQSRLQETAQDIGQIGQNLKSRFMGTADKIGTSFAATGMGEQSRIEGGFQGVGAIAGGVSGAIGDVVAGGVKLVLSQEQEDKTKEMMASVFTPIVQSAPVQASINAYKELQRTNPVIARDLEAGFNILSLYGGAGLSSKVASKGFQAGATAGQAGLDVASGVGRIAGGAKNMASGMIQTAQRIPERVATNIGAKKAAMEEINSLPSQVSRLAARDGIEVADINTLSSRIPKVNKDLTRRLYESVKSFASGKSQIRPEEIVGKPMTSALKSLEKQRGLIGSKLGQVADNLGDVTSREVFRPIYQSLTKVPGLQGLKVSGRGILDFSDTVLSSLSKADRSSIQKIFIESVRSGSGKQKHLLRQELFEILGGKKRSLSNMTDTVERSYEAIRKGLSDVLEKKNSSYKSLSDDYRKTIQPLQDLRKAMKADGLYGDILDMAGGLLARRLTSNAVSNPQIRQILRNIDTALKGKKLSSIESLQDIYNVLDKYYDIAAKTGFQGQSTAAGLKFLGKPGGLIERGLNMVDEVAGQTPLVRQKALEKLLGDLLK